jgi:hypothetical protein
LRSKANDLKLSRHRVLISDQDVIERYKAGATCLRIAKETKCSLTTVCRILDRGRVERRPDKYVSNKKYEVDHRYFDRITTQEKAYLLGFIYADGNVYKNNLTISLVKKRPRNSRQLFPDFKIRQTPS